MTCLLEDVPAFERSLDQLQDALLILDSYAAGTAVQQLACGGLISAILKAIGLVRA
jgi:hypothetical protein